MMFDVQISEQADRDLRDIFEHIAFELLAPENAAGQLDRLEDAISKLDNMPEKFRRYEREPWKTEVSECSLLITTWCSISRIWKGRLLQSFE